MSKINREYILNKIEEAAHSEKMGWVISIEEEMEKMKLIILSEIRESLDHIYEYNVAKDKIKFKDP